MGTLSSNYPNSNAVEAALDRANSAAHEITLLSEALASKASQAELATLSVTVSTKANQSALNETNAALLTKANASDLETTNALVATKADASGVNETTASLQAQIDAIITPVTQDAEVQNARVGTDGTSYQTLKIRLDAEDTQITGNLAEFENYIYSDNLVAKKFTKRNYGHYTVTAEGGILSNANYDSYIYAINPAIYSKVKITGAAAVCGWFSGHSDILRRCPALSQDGDRSCRQRPRCCSPGWRT